MRLRILTFVLCGAIAFASSFYLVPSVRNLISNQVASIIGIDVSRVRQWQLQNGLNRNLSLGDRGADVRLLQEGLNRAVSSTSTDSISGYYGQKTAQAVANFQVAYGLQVSGQVDTETRSAINNLYFRELCPEGQGNIYPDEILIHVNRDKALPTDYIPDTLIQISSLVRTTGLMCLTQTAALSLKQMFDAAEGDGVKLTVTSAFRRPEIQSLIQKMWIALKGEKAREGVADPLHSEHQLGTTVDLSGASISNAGADAEFDSTPEDAWLKQNAHLYGFVMSYPKDKMSVTGYIYEPWHYRYMGLDVAKEIYDKHISVEEYFATATTTTTK